MTKILIDTNILVYAIDEDSRYYSKSQELLFDSNYDLCTSSKNLSEFLAVTTRGPIHSLSIEDSLTVVEEFTDILTILYPNENSFSMFLKLLQKYKPTGVRIHDFEILSIALASGINQIATFNVKDFNQVKEVKLLLP